MSEENVIWIIKMYLFYGINTKDKVNGQQSNAIFFLFLFFTFYVFIFFIYFKFFDVRWFNDETTASST